jgi:hypothetical protein
MKWGDVLFQYTPFESRPGRSMGVFASYVGMARAAAYEASLLSNQYKLGICNMYRLTL